MEENEERKGEFLNQKEKKQQQKNSEEKQAKNSRQSAQRKEKIVDLEQIERHQQSTYVYQKIEEFVKVSDEQVDHEGKSVIEQGFRIK